MAQTSVSGTKRHPSDVAPSYSGPPPPTIISDGRADTTDGFVVQALGMLGLLEVYLFIAYTIGARVLFTDFEMLMFNVLSAFEFLGRLPGMLALCLVCNNSADIEHPDNMKTITRDQLHNMVHPRSPPRSRKRREFAALAWYSLLVTVIPVVLLLSFYPVWGSSLSDDPLWIRVVPSVLAVLAILESIAGFSYMRSNESCYVLTVMYANAKIISLFLLVCGANRLLLGEEQEDRSGVGLGFLGIPLACLQAVKIASASLAAVNYLSGRPDEELPTFLEAIKLCHFAHA